ncbi:hypothetical protein Avbf_15625, partial [Armadillidium vulgare]
MEFTTRLLYFSCQWRKNPLFAIFFKNIYKNVYNKYFNC